MYDIACFNINGEMITHLTQWDIGQKIVFKDIELPELPYVHFCNRNSKKALVVKPTSTNDNGLIVEVPNSLLREPYSIVAYVCEHDDDNVDSATVVNTLYTIRIPIKKRPQPEGYIYDEDKNVITITKINNQIIEILNTLDHKQDIYSYTIDLTAPTYDQNTWYPVTGASGIPRGSIHLIQVSASFDTCHPSWATNIGGYSCNMEIHDKAQEWGQVNSATYCTDYSWKYAGELAPCGYTQMYSASIPVVTLRGGGVYTIVTDFEEEWLVRTEVYVINSDTVRPINKPTFSINRSSIYANLNGDVTGNADSATRLQNIRYLEGREFNGTGDIHHYGECITAGDTTDKTVSIEGIHLKYGTRIEVKFYNANTAPNATLNVNGTGAKPIRYHGSAVPSGIISSGVLLTLVYDGTYWQIEGDLSQKQLTDFSNRLNSKINSVTAIKLFASSESADSATIKTWAEEGHVRNWSIDTSYGIIGYDAEIGETIYIKCTASDTGISQYIVATVDEGTGLDSILCTSHGFVNPGGDFKGSTSDEAGVAGMVPAPSAGGRRNLLTNSGWKEMELGFTSDAYPDYESELYLQIKDDYPICYVSLPAATNNNTGLMSYDDKAKLDSFKNAENYVEKSNAEITGSISQYRKPGSYVGNMSCALGDGCEASGNASHAEGDGTTASGHGSHAEGEQTIAKGDSQHVQGRFNVEDTGNKFAHIVGNGTSNSERSNAHTLDWDGNGWFAGKLSQEGTPTTDKDLATKKYVDDLKSGFYGVCDTASSQAKKTVTIPGITTLKTGIRIDVEFKNQNRGGDPTLNVNSLGAKPIQYSGSYNYLRPTILSGSILSMVYSGTAWEVVSNPDEMHVIKNKLDNKIKDITAIKCIPVTNSADNSTITTWAQEGYEKEWSVDFSSGYYIDAYIENDGETVIVRCTDSMTGNKCYITVTITGSRGLDSFLGISHGFFDGEKVLTGSSSSSSDGGSSSKILWRGGLLAGGTADFNVPEECWHNNHTQLTLVIESFIQIGALGSSVGTTPLFVTLSMGESGDFGISIPEELKDQYRPYYTNDDYATSFIYRESSEVSKYIYGAYSSVIELNVKAKKVADSRYAICSVLSPSKNNGIVITNISAYVPKEL